MVKRKVNRIVAAAGLAGAAIVASTAVAVGPAYAFPSNCGSGLASNGVAYAWCSTGTGHVQAVMGCEWFGWWTVAYGPWVNITAGSSSVACPWPYGPRWWGFNARD